MVPCGPKPVKGHKWWLFFGYIILNLITYHVLINWDVQYIIYWLRSNRFVIYIYIYIYLQERVLKCFQLIHDLSLFGESVKQGPKCLTPISAPKSHWGIGCCLLEL
jgi:hypothetical protein